MKKYLLLMVLVLVATGGWGDPLNQQTANECMRQAKEFLNDDNSYYKLQLIVISTTGKTSDSNLITVKKTDDKMEILAAFNYETLILLDIFKLAEKTIYDTDYIGFSNSEKTGHGTYIIKCYNKGLHFNVLAILRDMFSSFNLQTTVF